jgi:drug/metabolite transporter (DMT)-like permease
MAGPIATPISALCPAIGAIIGRIVFKQKLNFRMACGIVICVVATFMIGSTAFTGLEFNGQFLIGLAIALISALGWGIEGAVAGFGTGVIDYEISITIRQVTSGIVTLFILVPALFLIAGNLGLYPTMLIESVQGPLFTDGVLSSPLVFFLISGLAAGLSFGFWYKGNSMCGAALGMACNGMFSFWVPFFSFIVLGIYLGGGDAYFLTPIQWAAAIIMVIGIFLIAVNPLDWFKKDKDKEVQDVAA